MSAEDYEERAAKAAAKASVKKARAILSPKLVRVVCCPYCGGVNLGFAARLRPGGPNKMFVAVVCRAERCRASGPIRATQAAAVEAFNGRRLFSGKSTMLEIS